MRPWAAAFIVLAAPLALWRCGGPQCSFVAQCQNNVLQTCHTPTRSSGPQISTEDCGAEGATCVQQGPNQAQCIGNCDTTFVTHCSGTTLVYCDFSSGTGLIASTDCYNTYATYYGPGSCYDSGGGNAQCVSGP